MGTAAETACVDFVSWLCPVTLQTLQLRLGLCKQFGSVLRGSFNLQLLPHLSVLSTVPAAPMCYPHTWAVVQPVPLSSAFLQTGSWPRSPIRLVPNPTACTEDIHSHSRASMTCHDTYGEVGSH
jgi:hypothetical protein